MPMHSNPTRASSRPNTSRAHASHVRTAVLIDGSALFLSFRSLYEGRSLDYRALVQLLIRQVPGGLTAPGSGPGESLWVMWTSASPQNPGQSKFLEFAERELHWEVRPFAPAESFMVEPVTVLGISSDSRTGSRLVRFDAPIAFAAGRLADSHRIVVVTDSFGLADPLLRSATIGGTDRRPVLAFFGRALDSRWQKTLRTGGDAAPQFIDLDDYEHELFGGAGPEPPSHRAPHAGQIVF